MSNQVKMQSVPDTQAPPTHTHTVTPFKLIGGSDGVCLQLAFFVCLHSY